MCGVTIRPLFIVFSIIMLAGCGSSKQDLMTFLRKESAKMEWVKTCGEIADHDLPGEGEGVCWTMYERTGNDPDKIVLVTGVRMAENVNDQIMVLGVPKGVDLDRGMRIKFDEESPIKLKFTHCDDKTCYAQMPLDNDMLIKLKYSKRLVVAVMTSYNKAYGYRVPLYRFVYAYNNPPDEKNKKVQTAEASR